MPQRSVCADVTPCAQASARCHELHLERSFSFLSSPTYVVAFCFKMSKV